jgi:hypothetical protein
VSRKQFAREIEVIRKRLCDLVGPLGWKVCMQDRLLSTWPDVATFYVSRVIQLPGHPLDRQKLQQTFTIYPDQLARMGVEWIVGMWARQIGVDALIMIEQSITATPDAVVQGDDTRE